MTETVSEQKILDNILVILEDMTADWDMDFDGGLGVDTKLVEDLAFESIDIVQFIVAIEECFRRRGLPWEEYLMVDGRYRDEIQVGETVLFLHKHLNL